MIALSTAHQKGICVRDASANGHRDRHQMTLCARCVAEGPREMCGGNPARNEECNCESRTAEAEFLR